MQEQLAKGASVKSGSDTSDFTYDIVVIRPSGNPQTHPWREQLLPDGLIEDNVSLQYLIRQAYGVYDDKLWSGGPAWIDSVRFTLEAKVDPAANTKPTTEQRRSALQRVLADRFKLRVHNESRSFKVYALTVDKSGPKFSEAKDPQDLCFVAEQRGGITRREGCSMADLANLLRYPVGQTVVDRTGLKGRYDYALHWTPDNVPEAQAGNYSGPFIFTAIQEQLGLRLEPVTADLSIFVIDHAEMPTPN